MTPRAPKRKFRTSSRLSLILSVVFHALIIAALVYFAAREGLLGKQMKKIAVQMVKEPPPEKPREPEKPKEQPPRVEQPKVAVAPKVQAPVPTPQPAAPAPATVAAPPPAAAPPAAEIPDFVFEGGKAVQTTSDPVQLYRSLLETTFRSRWQRPADLNDDNFVAEVEVAVDRQGHISNVDWKRGSGNAKWDESVRNAMAATQSITRVPPTNFPPRVLIRFDVQDETEPLTAGGL